MAVETGLLKAGTGLVVNLVRPSFVKVAGFPIQNWGSCLAAAFLLSAWIGDVEFKRMKLDMDTCDLLLIAMAFGVIGSKLHCAVSDLIAGNKIAPLFSGTGLSFQGGFLLAATAMACYIKFYQKKSLGKALDAMSPALVMGYAVGKLGCFFAGDGCYGAPTDLPWGMHFPNALVPTKRFVHPVPLYESLVNFGLLAFLMWRARRPEGLPILNNMGTMFLILGFLRFFIEYVRVNKVVALGLTEYQWIAFGMIVFGVTVIAFSHTALAVRLLGTRHIPGVQEEGMDAPAPAKSEADKSEADTVATTEMASMSPDKKDKAKKRRSSKSSKTQEL